MMITGRVCTGLGKGNQYVPKYNMHFKEKLGMECHPGTLNLQIDEDSIDLVADVLTEKKEVRIEPEQGGIVDCYPVAIRSTKMGQKVYNGAIVIPHKTAHGQDTVELISPVHLRQELELQDGDEIICELV